MQTSYRSHSIPPRNNLLQPLHGFAITHSYLYSEKPLPGIFSIHSKLHRQAGWYAIGTETWSACCHFTGIIRRKHLHLEGTLRETHYQPLLLSHGWSVLQNILHRWTTQGSFDNTTSFIWAFSQCPITGTVFPSLKDWYRTLLTQEEIWHAVEPLSYWGTCASQSLCSAWTHGTVFWLLPWGVGMALPVTVRSGKESLKQSFVAGMNNLRKITGRQAETEPVLRCRYTSPLASPL